MGISDLALLVDSVTALSDSVTELSDSGLKVLIFGLAPASAIFGIVVGKWFDRGYLKELNELKIGRASCRERV